MDNKSENIALSATQIHILQNQAFTDNSPGAIVKDFNSLLDFIGAQGIIVSEKTQQFTLNVLAALNQQMHRPLDMKLKRPLQKSYPHINGLYLLLRCSGLSYLQQDGKKIRLMLSEQLLTDWYALNPTERYFSLLQAFCYRADAEIISECVSYGQPSCFFYCLAFFQGHLGTEIDVANSRYGLSHLRYIPGYYNLALMELFGFIEVECAIATEKETWPLSKIKATTWAQALLGYFSQYFGKVGVFTNPIDKPIDGWETEFKKYLPAWQQGLSLVLPKTNTEGTLVFSVNLGKAICRLAVPADITLDQLASGILSAFAFNNDHLYEFVYINQYGIEESIIHPYLDDGGDHFTTDTHAVGSLPLYQGMGFIFHFDFGDDWEFMVNVESMPTPKLAFTELTVLEKRGKPPKQYPDYGDLD